MALEAPEILLAAPEMALATELVRIPERIPEMVPAKELEIAQSGQWVLSSPPWVSFAVADPLTWLGIVLPEVLATRALLERELVLTAKALEQNVELAPFADSSYGSKEMKT